jgi:hypothetical protein
LQFDKYETAHKFQKGRQDGPQERRHPPATRYANMEAGSVAEMPVVPEEPLRATAADDQADRAAGDYTGQMGAS